MTQRPNRPNDASSKTILITVDVEDWFQVENLRSVYPIETWSHCESRVEANTHTMLDLFDQYGVQATFFVLGWIAERFPDLIGEIDQRGHEVASHGYEHRLCYQLQESTLREYLYKSKVVLEEIIRKPVFGYRAANFSITEGLLDMLKELGYRYDSSYNSLTLNRRYGRINDNWLKSSGSYLVAGNGMIEVPVSNLKIGWLTIPWGGGGYFRFWPPWLFRWGVSMFLREKDTYVFYCHPWEVDPAQPRVNGIGTINGFRHYVNLDKTGPRMQHLFTAFKGVQFISCRSYLQSIGLE